MTRGIVVRGEDGVVPVGKILCLGRNYVAHAREMGGTRPEEPVVFLKPSTALLPDGGTVVLPPGQTNVHHEVEMVVAIAREGRNLPVDRALDHVLGYGVGIDVTLRDLQARARERGEPWSIAKGFDTSAPVSTFLPRAAVPDPADLKFTLSVNGSVRQSGSTAAMVFGVPAVLSFLSRWFTLERGDLVFTGTPEGVGPIANGDRLEVTLSRGRTGAAPAGDVPSAGASPTREPIVPPDVRARFDVRTSPLTETRVLR
jgi:2-keto-4-pentenoate hydratase/2-oxohepta-3-ene-1,7-dioic acid hydratase in catechol pathway